MPRLALCLALAALAAIASIGCNTGTTSGPTAIAAATSFKDRMCACTTVACGTAVNTEMVAWAKAMKGDSTVVTTEQETTLNEILTDYGKCGLALKAPGSGAKPADAAPAAAPATPAAPVAPR